MQSTRHIKRLAAALASSAVVGGIALVPVSHGDLQSQINAQQSAAASLKAQVAADTAKIQHTSGGLAAARAQLDQVQTKLNVDVARLRTVQTHLMEARDQLAALESRLHAASTDLAANLTEQYENGTPNLVSAILDSQGFSQLLNEVNFQQRVSQQDAHIVGTTRTARTQVLGETVKLGNLEESDKSLTDQILSQRNQAAALQNALLTQEISETQARSGANSALAGVNSKLGSLRTALNNLEAKEAAEARESAQQATTQVNQQAGLAIDTGGMVQAPAGAPAAVKEMIAAGNAINTLPYIWGGGHGSFISPGYDCSGSVSYVLAAAGLLSAPEVSGDFESYGDAGPGQWVTIYAASGHVWMTIAGWRFDTVALAEDGSRWTQGGGEFSGFVVRHPPGL